MNCVTVATIRTGVATATPPRLTQTLKSRGFHTCKTINGQEEQAAIMKPENLDGHRSIVVLIKTATLSYLCHSCIAPLRGVTHLYVWEQ